MTDTVNVPREVLERIAAADFEGVFCYEENPQYEGANTSGHIIRYRPRQQPPAPDGSRSVKLSFPVLAAASWLDDVESVLPVFAEFLTYAPALAKVMLAAAPKAEPVSDPYKLEGPPREPTQSMMDALLYHSSPDTTHSDAYTMWTSAHDAWMRDDAQPLSNPQQFPEAPKAEPVSETDDLIDGFAAALKSKLNKAAEKYGYNDDWMRPEWREDLVRHLIAHVEKGDPRDVAAYCAFAWHHGWSVKPEAPKVEQEQ